MEGPFFEVFVCQGRMCTANGSDAVAEMARPHANGARCRVLRGGCYGLCEIGPNVVVRRYTKAPPADLLGPDPNGEADRLTLTDAPNEAVYSGLTPAEAVSVIASHLSRDEGVPALTREARERALPPLSPVAAKLRALREARRRGRPGEDGSSG